MEREGLSNEKRKEKDCRTRSGKRRIVEREAEREGLSSEKGKEKDCRAKSGNGCVAREGAAQEGARSRTAIERARGGTVSSIERASSVVERAARLRVRSGVASEKRICECCVMRLSEAELEIVREPLHTRTATYGYFYPAAMQSHCCSILLY